MNYRNCKQEVQRLLRDMQDKWWRDRADELQAAADKRALKTFYDGLKEIYVDAITIRPFGRIAKVCFLFKNVLEKIVSSKNTKKTMSR